MPRIETKEQMLDKPTEIAFYATKFGFLQREDAPSVALDEQFIWVAKLTAQPGKRDEMVEACRIHTENVKRTENETFTFLVLESTDNDVDILLFERYSSESYFKDVHSTSDSMKEYRSKIEPILAKRDSAGFSAVAGFLDKRETIF
ncbi:hypothetical protein LTR37_006010 [Vermiconidia calcicola]|uniref:Uncharacterized protein n=1 Tax=Vermiconidia calcicola TaxID=1690605 RepID=A0ACC3NH59_9PEZI|nr:hypothetical protein LTR37_006010 [Vermiconidia calcicola]